MNKNIIIAFILSFCSFSYEFLLIKISAQIIGDSFLWRSLIIGFFIIGLGFGAYAVEKLKLKKIEFELISVEYKIVLFASFIPLLIYSFEIISNIIFFYERSLHPENMYDIFFLKENMFIYKYFFMSSLIIATTTVGYLTGKEMPLLMLSSNKNQTDKFLFFNYLGSLFSSILFSFFILKGRVSIEFCFLIISLINLSVILILKINKDNIIKSLYIIAIILTVYPVSNFLNRVERYQKYNLSYFNIWEDFYDSKLLIESERTKYQSIDFVHFDNQETLYLNGEFQFTIGKEADYHEAMVHLPYGLLIKHNKNDKKQNVLVLGGGDGFLLRELFKYPEEYFDIDHVELDEDFLLFCKNNKKISLANNYSLNKAINRYFTDGFSYLKKTRKKYDLIVIDFPYPYSYDLSKLYSKEFFKEVQDKLSENGISIMDIPIFRRIDLNNRKKLKTLNDTIYSTIYSVFRENSLFFKINEEGFVLMTKNEKITINELSSINIGETKSSFSSSEISFLKNQQLNLNFNRELINSIFKPTIRDISSQHQKY